MAKRRLNKKRLLAVLALCVFIVIAIGLLALFINLSQDLPQADQPLDLAQMINKKKNSAESAESKKETYDDLVTDDADEYIYSPNGKKDPFRSFDFSPRRIVKGESGPLEKYDYDELSFTAVLSGKDDLAAIVEGPDGKGYTVRVGTRIGKLGGIVTAIDKNKITIEEKFIEFDNSENSRVIDLFLRNRDE